MQFLFLHNMTHHKKILFYGLIILTSVACKSALYNLGLERLGVYEDKITLKQLQTIDKEIVFFPIIHVGTELMYQDISYKIDSLNKLDYYFYLEGVQAEKKSDSVLRKYKKMIGSPLVKQGYIENIDSLFNSKFKAKKPIVNQPTYEKLGINTKYSRNVDVIFSDIINYYEDQYGEIILEPCDFETDLFSETTCKNDTGLTKEIKDNVIINFRNRNVLKEILADTLTKIAIIYGKAHYEGIKEGLLNEGYTEQ